MPRLVTHSLNNTAPIMDKFVPRQTGNHQAFDRMIVTGSIKL
jgi:hypothetical protein